MHTATHTSSSKKTPHHMSKTAEKKKVGKVMHEYKEGTLRSGPQGKGGKVKSRDQAIAIAMSESGQSRKTAGKNKKVSSRRSAKSA